MSHFGLTKLQEWEIYYFGICYLLSITSSFYPDYKISKKKLKHKKSMENKIKISSITLHINCLYFTTIKIYAIIYIETVLTNIFVSKPVTYICVCVLLNVVKFTCSW